MIIAFKRFTKVFFIILAILCALFIFSIPIILTEAHGAAGAGTHHVPTLDEILRPLIFRFINFIVFVSILILVARKPLRGFLIQRRKQVEEIIQSSAEKKAWAEQMFADYNRRLEGIGKEIEEIKISLKKEGEFESSRIVSHAQEVAKNLSRDTQMIAQAEIDGFKNELRTQTIEMAAEVARETVMRVMNADDQKRLAQTFVADLQGKPAGGVQ